MRVRAPQSEARRTGTPKKDKKGGGDPGASSARLVSSCFGYGAGRGGACWRRRTQNGSCERAERPQNTTKPAWWSQSVNLKPTSIRTPVQPMVGTADETGTEEESCKVAPSMIDRVVI